MFYIYLNDVGHVVAIRHEADSDACARLRKFRTSRGGAQESTLGFAADLLRRPRTGLGSENKKDLAKQIKNFVRDLERGKTNELQRRVKLAELLALTESNWTTSGGAGRSARQNW